MMNVNRKPIFASTWLAIALTLVFISVSCGEDKYVKCVRSEITSLFGKDDDFKVTSLRSEKCYGIVLVESLKFDPNGGAPQFKYLLFTLACGESNEMWSARKELDHPPSDQEIDMHIAKEELEKIK